jgi:hypothetical protein
MNTKIRLYKEQRVVLSEVTNKIKQFNQKNLTQKDLGFPNGLAFHMLFSQFQYMKKYSSNFALVAYDKEKKLLLALNHAINCVPEMAHIYRTYIIQLEKIVFEHELASKDNQHKVKI